MARTRKRIATTRSFATQSSQPAIRFLQDQSMPILEPVIQAENVDQNEHRCATMKVSLPPFSSFSSHGGGSPLSAETNVLLTNLANLLQQQKERLIHVEEVKEKIPT